MLNIYVTVLLKDSQGFQFYDEVPQYNKNLTKYFNEKWFYKATESMFCQQYFQ